MVNEVKQEQLTSTTTDPNATQEVNPDEAKPTEGNDVDVIDKGTEGDNQDNQPPSGEETPPQPQEKEPSVEELQTKLKEYEVNKEEEAKLKERLGIKEDIDDKTLGLLNIDSQIINQGKQEYLRLCNQYGVNADPDKVTQSLDELKKTDPAKGYEFERRIELLGQDISSKRGQVAQQKYVNDVTKFVGQYQQILDSSPVINNIISDYVESNVGSNNISGELDNIMGLISAVYNEAMEVGKQLALTDKAKTDTSKVTGGVATANSTTYTGEQLFTRDQIKKMSSAEFAKNEKVIMQQMAEGKIQ